MAFHQTQNKDKLAHLTAKDCQQHHSHMPVPSYTQYKCSHYWDITSINCICRKESCDNLVVRPSVQPYMTKMPGWLQKLSHGNEHWAVNTCKYWQGWPQAKRATAHLDLNRFSGMTKFPPHCLPTHEHALQKCPLATSKKETEISAAYTLSSTHKANLDSPWTLRVFILPCTETHPSPSASLPVSLTHTCNLNMIYQRWKTTFIILWWVIIPTIVITST